MATTFMALQCCERSSTLQVKAIAGEQDAGTKTLANAEETDEEQHSSRTLTYGSGTCK